MLGSESGPFERTPGFLASFCLPRTDGIPVDFHSQMLWGRLFLTLVLRAAELGVELGPFALHGGPLQPKYPPNSQLPYLSVGLAHFMSPLSYSFEVASLCS